MLLSSASTQGGPSRTYIIRQTRMLMPGGVSGCGLGQWLLLRVSARDLLASTPGWPPPQIRVVTSHVPPFSFRLSLLSLVSVRDIRIRRTRTIRTEPHFHVSPLFLRFETFGLLIGLILPVQSTWVSASNKLKWIEYANTFTLKYSLEILVR